MTNFLPVGVWYPTANLRPTNPPGAEVDAARAHRGGDVAGSIGMEMVETTGGKRNKNSI